MDIIFISFTAQTTLAHAFFWVQDPDSRLLDTALQRGRARRRRK